MENLKVYDENLNEVKVKSAGKLVFLTLWSKDCKYCNKQLHYIDDIYEEYGKDLTLYIVCSLKDEKEIEDVKKYFEDEKYKFKLYFDVDYSLAKIYKTVAYPTTVFLDKNLNTLAKIVGVAEKEELIENIELYR